MMRPPSFLARLLLWAGIDQHVLATLMSRGWTILAGAGTVLLVPFFLSSTEQGYYYTFTSLLGLQILFELGLGQVILQLVGHEAAHLTLAENHALDGDAARLDHIATLIQLLQRWYLAATLLFCLLAGGAGSWFLHRNGHLPLEQWLPVWTVLVLSTGVSLACVPAIALHEGLGQIGQIARLRLAQSVLGYSLAWCALVGHLGLWAACLVPVVTAGMTVWWIARFGRVHRWLMNRRVNAGQGTDWKRDVLPLQWRIALSAASGYFMFYAFTPLVFANQGPAAAGRFGIAMAVFNALAAVGTSWVYAKSPSFAMHVSRGERTQLNALFAAVLRRSLVFTAVAAATVVVSVAALRWAGVPQVERIASPDVLTCLALACIANSLIFSVAAYMRAHREEPMLPVSLIGASATGLIAWQGSAHGLLPMSALYALLTVGVILPWSLALFRRYHRRR